MNNANVAIIGAGITGLTIGTKLIEAGVSVTLFDKSRGVSGRLATRRAEVSGKVLRFDHGTPFLTTDQTLRLQQLGPSLKRDFLPKLATETSLVDSKKALYLSIPDGINRVGKRLAKKLNLHLNVAVTGVHRAATESRWLVAPNPNETQQAFDWVILTTPPQQALKILESTQNTLSPLLNEIEPVGCWSLMLAMAEPLTGPDLLYPDSRIVERIICEHKKRRPCYGMGVYTIQAHRSWSQHWIESNPKSVARMMLGELGALGYETSRVIHQQLHRWLYAGVSNPLDCGFLMDSQQRLMCAGDWCLGNDVGSALDSAEAAAAQIIQSLG